MTSGAIETWRLESERRNDREGGRQKEKAINVMREKRRNGGKETIKSKTMVSGAIHTDPF